MIIHGLGMTIRRKGGGENEVRNRVQAGRNRGEEKWQRQGDMMHGLESAAMSKRRERQLEVTEMRMIRLGSGKE